MNQKARNYVLSQDKILAESELKAMLKAIRPHMEQSIRTGRFLHYINDYYLILIGSLTGMRVSEIASVKIDDIADSSVRVLGKGKKIRIIPLGKKGRTAVAELLRLKSEVMKQSTDPDQFLFSNRNRKRFTRFAIGRRFNYWRVRCGIERQINFHSLRHYYATFLLNSGFHLHEASKILGHSSIGITGMYLHFTDQTQDKVDAVL